MRIEIEIKTRSGKKEHLEFDTAEWLNATMTVSNETENKIRELKIVETKEDEIKIRLA